MVNVHARYLRTLEARGAARPRARVPARPTKQLAERQASGLGLTTPEFAVLLAYTKTTNVREMLASDLPDDPYLSRDLVRYFPTPLRERFAAEMAGHRLRREIVATRIANQMVNLSGISFDYRMTEETGAVGRSTARARTHRQRVRFSRCRTSGHRSRRSTARSPRMCSCGCCCAPPHGRAWRARLLRHRRPPLDITATVAAFSDGVQELAVLSPRCCSAATATRSKRPRLPTRPPV